MVALSIQALAQGEAIRYRSAGRDPLDLEGAMARHYTYDSSPHALFTPAKGLGPEDFFQEWNEADFAEIHLLCAEMCRLAYAEEPVVTPALKRVGFAMRGWMGGLSLQDRFASWGGDGFVATGPGGRTVIAYRGTESAKPEDLAVDLLVAPVPWGKGGNVHGGFAHVVGLLRERLDRILKEVGPGPVVITGHSLGAALATLVATELTDRPRTLVTFGSPLVGDTAFTALFGEVSVARFVDCCDLVARVPPERIDVQHVVEFLLEVAGLPPSPIPVPGPSLPWRFAHVSPPKFVDVQGLVHDGLSPDQMRAQRAAARKAYGVPGVHLDLRSIAGARDLLRALRNETANPRAVIQTVVRKLIPTGGSDRVPLRDLADHAPLNYIRAMARSFRGQGA